MNYSRSVSTLKLLRFAKYSEIRQYNICSTYCNTKRDSLKQNSILKPIIYNLPQVKSVVTKQFTAEKAKDGFLVSFIKKIGFLDHAGTRLKVGGYFLYENITDELDYQEWFTNCNLPNSFMSWFVITELHVWMLSVRCMAEGVNGRTLRNSIIEAMWSDVTIRAKLLHPGSATMVRKNVAIYSEQFQAALIGYDEGLLGGDKELAGVIWRRFYEMDCDNIQLIENLVKYIRKQIILLEDIPQEVFLDRPKIEWIPLVDKK